MKDTDNSKISRPYDDKLKEAYKIEDNVYYYPLLAVSNIDGVAHYGDWPEPGTAVVNP